MLSKNANNLHVLQPFKFQNGPFQLDQTQKNTQSASYFKSNIYSDNK